MLTDLLSKHLTQRKPYHKSLSKRLGIPTKALINAPKLHNPGKGQPIERLAYINANERKMLKMHGGSGKKTKDGIESFSGDPTNNDNGTRAGSSVGSSSHGSDPTNTSQGTRAGSTVGGGGSSGGQSGATQSGQNAQTHADQSSGGKTTPSGSNNNSSGGGAGSAGGAQGQRGTSTGPADSRPSGSGGNQPSSPSGTGGSGNTPSTAPSGTSSMQAADQRMSTPATTPTHTVTGPSSVPDAPGIAAPGSNPSLMDRLNGLGSGAPTPTRPMTSPTAPAPSSWGGLFGTTLDAIKKVAAPTGNPDDFRAPSIATRISQASIDPAEQRPITSDITDGRPIGTVPAITDPNTVYGPAMPANPDDVQRMAKMLQAESGVIRNPDGSINYPAMQGVGSVIRNRIDSPDFPNTLSGVLNQPKQFSPMADGSYRKAVPSQEAIDIAKGMLTHSMPSNVGTAMNYGNLDTIKNKPGYSSEATKKAFGGMDPVATFADAKNPSLSHTFGTIGAPADKVMQYAQNGPNATSQVANASPMSAAPPAQNFNAAVANPVPQTSIRAVDPGLIGTIGGALYDTVTGKYHLPDVIGPLSQAAGAIKQYAKAASIPIVGTPAANAVVSNIAKDALKGIENQFAGLQKSVLSKLAEAKASPQVQQAAASAAPTTGIKPSTAVPTAKEVLAARDLNKAILNPPEKSTTLGTVKSAVVTATKIGAVLANPVVGVGVLGAKKLYDVIKTDQENMAYLKKNAPETYKAEMAKRSAQQAKTQSRAGSEKSDGPVSVATKIAQAGKGTTSGSKTAKGLTSEGYLA